MGMYGGKRWKSKIAAMIRDQEIYTGQLNINDIKLASHFDDKVVQERVLQRQVQIKQNMHQYLTKEEVKKRMVQLEREGAAGGGAGGDGGEGGEQGVKEEGVLKDANLQAASA